MSEIAHFNASITQRADDSGSMTARIAPFGESRESPYGNIRFEASSFQVPDVVPLIVDHSEAALDRIGVMTRFFKTDSGAFGEFKISDTPAGQAVRALLSDGALTDVSVGVADYSVNDGVMSGVLDHVAVVAHGRFGNTTNPSKVLAVNSDEGENMSEPVAAAEVATNDEKVETAQFAELATAVADLASRVDKLGHVEVNEPHLFQSLGEFAKAKVVASMSPGEIDAATFAWARDKMAKHNMSADTTTTGAGAVPDYLASEFLTVLKERVFTNSVRRDPIGDHGMTVSYPTMGTKPTVTAQSAQFDQPSSTTTSVTTTDFDLVTYSGANRVAQQLIARSQPSFVDILMRELVSAYNGVTDAAGIAAVVATRTGAHTAELDDLGADAAVTYAAFLAANTAIIADMRRPADTIWLAPDRWAQIQALVDSEGRPLLVAPGNGPSNALGTGSLVSMTAIYHGWRVLLVPDAAAETCLIGIADRAAVLESEVPRLQVQNVDTLSTDFGIWGLYKAATKYPNAFYDLTVGSSS